MIEIGGKAPDFTLKDQNGNMVRLSTFKGKKVLLSFRPLAWTAVCHDQMRSLEENHLLLDEFNTVALGIGVDSVPITRPGHNQWISRTPDFFLTFGLTEKWRNPTASSEKKKAFPRELTYY